MVPVVGFELTTYRLQGDCSTPELNRLVVFDYLDHRFNVAWSAFQQTDPALNLGFLFVHLGFVQKINQLFYTETDDFNFTTSGVAGFFALYGF
jgi:hypothetical protein